jgi:Predicted membrane protein
MWMDTAKDSLLVAGRIVTIFPLMLVVGLFMGKRSIGELPVFDFLVIIALGAVVGADIADPKIEHIHTAVAIILIGLLQRVVSSLTIKSRKFGKLITFEPTVVVYQGNLLMSNLKKVRYSIDNISQMLREKDIFHLGDVELAVLEANGKLSVYKKDQKSVPALEDLGLVKQQSSLSYPLIIEGNVLQETLTFIRKDLSWLASQLQAKKLRQDDVVYASVDTNGEIYVSGTTAGPPPPMLH